jgi:tRNA (guanine37-N1)-methyltransferase
MRKILKGYDIIGNIAILKFDKASLKDKKEEASKLMLINTNIKTCLEKSEKIKGKLRTYKTKYILGKNTKETIHKESSCFFKLDVEKCYFSPRLSNERKQINDKIIKLKNKKDILVLFAGVSPYSIIIAKNNKKSIVYSNELNKIACKYGEENTKLNKTPNVKIIPGDVKKIALLIKKYSMPKKYDIIVMPRAQLDYTFLKEAFSISKKNTIIFFREFCKEEELKEKIENLEKEAKKSKKKIKILNITKTNEIAPYKFRYMIEFQIL